LSVVNPSNLSAGVILGGIVFLKAGLGKTIGKVVYNVQGIYFNSKS
jgi:hypothetical protein